MFIYSTTNLINNKQYVGQTIKESGVEYLGSGLLIMKAIKKYGKGSFERQVLIECSSQQELNEQEIFWIGRLDTMIPNGYNLALGGVGPGRCSEETKRRISEANIGKICPAERRERISETRVKRGSAKGKNNPNYGNSWSEETKRRISEGNKNKIISEETKRKQSEALKGRQAWNKGRTFSEEIRSKMSKSKSGENNPMYSKCHSEETKRRISESLQIFWENKRKGGC